MANDERLLYPDEEYFIAKIEQDALQLNEAGTYSTVVGSLPNGYIRSALLPRISVLSPARVPVG